MKLNELKGVKKYYSLTRHDLELMLEKDGIEVIGRGRYGVVYWHKSWDYVVKITKDDPYYMSFIDYVIKHPNKHYPKIVKKPMNLRAFYTRLRKNKDEKLFIVKIEKLEPLPKALGKFIVEHLDTFIMVDHHLKHLDKDEESKHFLDHDYKGNKNITTLLPNGTRVPYITPRQLAKDYPWMVSLAKAWYDAVEGAQGDSDLHAENFMKRKDGTVVVIDPAWEGWSPYKEHDRIMAMERDDYEDYEDTVSGPAHKVKDKEYPSYMQQTYGDIIDQLEDVPF